MSILGVQHLIFHDSIYRIEDIESYEHFQKKYFSYLYLFLSF